MIFRENLIPELDTAQKSTERKQITEQQELKDNEKEKKN